MGVLRHILYFSAHPTELVPIIQWKLQHRPLYKRDLSSESQTLKDCFIWLKMTSRSFAMVVQELHPELVVPVVMYYLVLRGLDTIEDDMTIPLAEKEPLLRTFDTVLDEDGWTYTKSGPNESDRELLIHFDDVITEFKLIEPKYQEVIKDITRRMGNGMADYAIKSDRNLGAVETVEEYELYCHYVAGLVGHGLTKLFVEGNFANSRLKYRLHFSESMGQFLQKTNVIRDVREDFDDGRQWWPKEIWSKYVDTFGELFNPAHSEAALACSSDMVLNALKHAEECMSYMASIEYGVFAFVAIPQVMAIATLELVFQNPAVFQRNVKISKGDAARLIMEASRDLEAVCAVFRRYIWRIQKKNNPKDPNYLNISVACAQVEKFIETLFPSQSPADKSMTQADKATFSALFASPITLFFGLATVMIAAIMYRGGTRADTSLFNHIGFKP